MPLIQKLTINTPSQTQFENIQIRVLAQLGKRVFSLFDSFSMKRLNLSII